MVPIRSHLSIATTALVLVVPVVTGVVVGRFSGRRLRRDRRLPRLRPRVHPAVLHVVRGCDPELGRPRRLRRGDAARGQRGRPARAGRRRSRSTQRAIRRMFEVTDLLIEDRPLVRGPRAHRVHGPRCVRTAKRGAAAPGGFTAGSGGVGRRTPVRHRVAPRRACARCPCQPRILHDVTRRRRRRPWRSRPWGAPSDSSTPGGPTSARTTRNCYNTFANHMALALERAQLREQALRTELLEEVDRLQRALLWARSHTTCARHSPQSRHPSTLRNDQANVDRRSDKSYSSSSTTRPIASTDSSPICSTCQRVQAGALESAQPTDRRRRPRHRRTARPRPHGRHDRHHCDGRRRPPARGRRPPPDRPSARQSPRQRHPLRAPPQSAITITGVSATMRTGATGRARQRAGRAPGRADKGVADVQSQREHPGGTEHGIVDRQGVDRGARAAVLLHRRADRSSRFCFTMPAPPCHRGHTPWVAASSPCDERSGPAPSPAYGVDRVGRDVFVAFDEPSQGISPVRLSLGTLLHHRPRSGPAAHRRHGGCPRGSAGGPPSRSSYFRQRHPGRDHLPRRWGRRLHGHPLGVGGLEAATTTSRLRQREGEHWAIRRA